MSMVWNRHGLDSDTIVSLSERRIWRSAMAVIAAALFATVVAACGSSKAVHTTSAPAAAQGTATTNGGQSPQWAGEGRRLVAAKQAQRNNPNRPVGIQPSNDNDFAYQSEPVDINTNGDYTLTFGPVDDSYDPPTYPRAIGWENPPDVHFHVAFASSPSIVTINGKRFLQHTIRVSNLTSPYPQFTEWAY